VSASIGQIHHIALREPKMRHIGMCGRCLRHRFRRNVDAQNRVADRAQMARKQPQPASNIKSATIAPARQQAGDHLVFPSLIAIARVAGGPRVATLVSHIECGRGAKAGAIGRNRRIGTRAAQEQPDIPRRHEKVQATQSGARHRLLLAGPTIADRCRV
jgi:hypothetical protein